MTSSHFKTVYVPVIERGHQPILNHVFSSFFLAAKWMNVHTLQNSRNIERGHHNLPLKATTCMCFQKVLLIVTRRKVPVIGFCPVQRFVGLTKILVIHEMTRITFNVSTSKMGLFFLNKFNRSTLTIYGLFIFLFFYQTDKQNK